MMKNYNIKKEEDSMVDVKKRDKTQQEVWLDRLERTRQAVAKQRIIEERNQKEGEI